MTQTVFGERLRQARKLRRLTQTKLATAAGIKQATLSMFENGLAQPSIDTLESLARETRFPHGFFFREPGASVPLGSLLYRGRRHLARLDEDEAHAWTEIAVETYFAVGGRAKPLRVDLSDIDPIEAAGHARSTLGLAPDVPIPNLTYTVEAAGITVLAVPIKLEGRDAFSTWVEQAPVILIPAGAPGDRLRFSVAHELAHVLRDRTRGGSPDAEREADRFAGEFLLPERALRDELVRPLSIQLLRQLRRRWGVSIEALAYRAVELGIVSSRRARQLYIQATMLRRDGDLEDLPVEKPRMLRKLAEARFGPAATGQAIGHNMGLTPEMATGILRAHAARQELVSTVPRVADGSGVVVSFPGAGERARLQAPSQPFRPGTR